MPRVDYVIKPRLRPTLDTLEEGHDLGSFVHAHVRGLIRREDIRPGLLDLRERGRGLARTAAGGILRNQTREIYAHLSESRLRRAVAKLNEPAAFSRDGTWIQW